MTNKKKPSAKTGESEPAKDSEILLQNEGLRKEVDDLKCQLAEKTEQSQGYFAQLQRGQADFENYQKRVEAEKGYISERACESLISGLLETLDNFERAFRSIDGMQEEHARGFALVHESMLNYLRENGLERIAAAGCQFDPRKHEAIMQSETPDAADGTVLDEFQAGYTVKGRVIRPAKVRVARAVQRKQEIEIDTDESDDIEKKED